MTNQDAYINDLNELEAAITALVHAIPSGTTKKAVAAKEEAERIARSARTTIHCMKNDYIPVEF